MTQTGRKTTENITREKLLTSILMINQLLVRPVSIDRVLNAIVEETQKIFDLTRVAIFMVNKEARLLQTKYVSPTGFNAEEMERTMTRPLHLDRHPCRETLVAKTGQTVYIVDRFNDPRITPIDLKMDLFWKRFSTIAAPLRIEQDIIGVLEGDATNRALHLSENEVDLFTFFANQASIIIENAMLQDRNRRKILQLLLLQEVTRKSSLTLNVDELIYSIAASAVRLTKAESSLVFITGEYEKHLRRAGGSGEPVSEKELLALGEGIVGGVAATGQPALIHDARKVSESSGPDVRSQLAIPIATEKKVLGVVSVYSDRISAFSNTDLEILSIMASHAAVLFQNAALYEQLSVEKHRAENILESSHNGVITINGGGFIQSVNRKAEQIFEIDRKSMMGKSIFEIGDDRIEKVLGIALRKEPRPSIVEASLVKKSGEDSILEITTSSVKRLEDVSTGFIITFRDITEAKKSEEIIRRMDRLSSLGQLSAGIAHEIRNPLSGIKLNLQMLSKKIKEDPESIEKISDSLEGIRRINNLIKSVLNFARPTVPMFKRDYLQRVLKDTVGIMEAQFKRKKIRVTMDLPPAVPEIAFDENQIRQVFVNILLNAMEGMPDGGTIKITGAMDNYEPGKAGLFRLVISDNGSGIRQDLLPKIFDPFFTTKPEGTGLGLSIAYKILEQHNAAVEVESTDGVGTVFTLTFPMNAVEAENVPA
ncbi:MAG: GAF domain-containing protein [Syntrophobacteraceae bacterium]|jgi:two-component system NtrC family sensor kinase